MHKTKRRDLTQARKWCYVFCLLDDPVENTLVTEASFLNIYINIIYDIIY